MESKKKIQNDKFHNLRYLTNIIGAIKSRTIKWARYTYIRSMKM